MYRYIYIYIYKGVSLQVTRKEKDAEVVESSDQDGPDDCAVLEKATESTETRFENEIVGKLGF